MSSIAHYNKHPKAFFDRTINVDLSDKHEKFLSHLPSHAKILDAACGSGRDAKAFLDAGYEVEAFDGAIELTHLASEAIGQPVRCLTFQELDYSAEFDAIWTNASLLHVPYDELRGVLKRLHQALKPNGVFYASFKYGSTSRLEKGRTFYDMTEEMILPYLDSYFDPIEIWKSSDRRSHEPDRSGIVWLNLLSRAL